jgi:hypothetical protein
MSGSFDFHFKNTGMKYLLTSLVLISCGNYSSRTTTSFAPASQVTTANKGTRDTVYIPLPEPSRPFAGYKSIIDLGCRPDMTNDCGKIISDYIATQPVNAVINLRVPAGRFYLAKTIYCEDRRLNLVGDGRNLSIFYVKDGVVGIWVDRKYGAAYGNYMASFSIAANGHSIDTADGIRIWQTGTVNDVEVSGFGGSGIRVDGYVIGDPKKDAAHNASFAKIYDCIVAMNASDGILIDGSDGNACITMGNDIRNNGGWGLRESSFLGGTHIGNMFHANKLGPFTVDHPTNASVFIGGYTEGDQTPGLIYSTNQVVGKQQYFSGVKYK